MSAHSYAAIFRWRGLKTVGVMNRPAGREGRRFPAVLFLHGFPGAEKNVDVQRRLLASGVASYSLYFAGAWGSEGRYRFSDQIAQARAALRFLARQPFVDRKRLGVFGFSMGGWAALNVAGLEPGLRAAVAAAPVGGPDMVGRGSLEFVRRSSRPLRALAPRALQRDFCASVTRSDPAAAASRKRCPLLLVHGDADQVIPLSASRRILAAAAEPKRLVIASGARHDFLDRREWFSRLVADWLKARLRA